MRGYFVITLLLFFSGCGFQNRFVLIDKNIQEHKNRSLINRYIHYWNCMSQKDFKCTYQYEMPHQRFLHDFTWYKEFNRGNRKNYKIKVLEIVPKRENVTYIKSKFISADNQISYIFWDRWYKVNGKWYHKMKVSLLPLGENED
ncbi:hypothetical protein [Nitratiruptor sp. YY09-18]|uniref:hypothetical protein n=1 Tax=Nitratiruptor sp. YY09-18 TaxID=2724901 RepID=UPI0018EB2E2E|nr:hypothetical protein [Nitratiruptor sp. YY09-18]BCD68943.1 hypothetical protein NitYY0918_P10 [Nitratiruptor sp. YY09-18]